MNHCSHQDTHNTVKTGVELWFGHLKNNNNTVAGPGFHSYSSLIPATSLGCQH